MRSYEEEVGGSLIVYSEDGKQSVLLQGEYSDGLRDTIEELEEVWARVQARGETSYGPFKSYEEHLDFALSEYDAAMQ